MTEYATETRADYLERNIAEVRTQRSFLLNSSWDKIQRDDPHLQKLEASMTAELNEIRPYRVVPNGPKFVVAFEGDFIRDETGKNWLLFDTADLAQSWIDDALLQAVAAE
jgi:hypothetical protein